MKHLIVICAVFLYSTTVFGVYGEDNRLDVYQVSDQEVSRLTSAIAYQVERHYELKGWKFLRNWTIVTRSFNKQNICDGEAFIGQPSMRTNCTGTLIGPKTLLTAGNCITDHYCKNDLYYWMFDYNLKSEGMFSNKRPRKNFYTCKKIIKRVFDPKSAISYTLIELNKEVKGVEPVTLSEDSRLNINDELIVMGHIKGLPLKVSQDPVVKDINDRHFILNSDISGKSLGAPIFNKKTRELEGMMIHGTPNYTLKDGGCYGVNQFIDDDARELAIRVEESFLNF